MTELNFEAPFNSLSLGNVSVNFLRELFKRDIKINVYPISERYDLSAYNKLDEEFIENFKICQLNSLSNFKKETKTLKVWHIKDCHKTLGENQYLYTFYEVDSPTKEEINIVKAQKHVFFSSSEACEIFKFNGCDNVSHVPLGFDEDFSITDRKYLPKDVIHFGLIGKIEKRKNTAALLKLWADIFGNNNKYQLSCLINNPFLDKSTQEIVDSIFNGATYSNINLLPHLKTNEEVNHLMNSIDIDLSGLSNGEGWNLPSFNCTCLGKWSLVTNCSSHKDWATKENSILVEPDGMQECYDGVFFREGLPFNQGQYYKISHQPVRDAIKKAVSKCKTINKEGVKLQEKFTYKKTIDQILSTMEL